MESFELVRPAQIGLTAWDEMRGAYDVLELSTAVKPWLLRWLLQEHDDGSGTAYLDPDICVTSRMVELEATLLKHSAVLTPHVTRGMPRDGKRPSETDILLAGVYNLGFIGLSNSAPAHELLDWWSERLLTDCHVAPERALFVDQRWVDFVPGLVAELDILRDPTYNVAYWNLPERRLSTAEDGTYEVNGRPLRFYHFSGYDPDAPDTLSKHQNRTRLVDEPVLLGLCHAYADTLNANGYDDVRDFPYEHDLLPSGMRLTKLMRSLYRAGVEADQLRATIFTTSGEVEFVAWLNEAAVDEPQLTRYLYALWSQRADLQRAYPHPGGGDREGFLGWCAVHGRSQVGIPEALLARDPQELDGPAAAAVPVPAAARSPRRRSGLPLGVNVVGYLRSELGVGEVARQFISALDAAGVPALPVGLHAPDNRQGHSYATAAQDRNPFAVNLICVNADGLPAFAAEAGREFLDDKYNIGVWWWETSRFPPEHLGAFEYLDEVWAGSRFIAETLSAVAPIPVVHVPLALDFPLTLPRDPGALGLPDAYTFLFSYDYNSVAARKNPLGALEAYTRAFGPEDGTILVLKSINGDRHASAHRRVREAAADRTDVIVLDEYLDQADKDRLMASCDCYVSLHRSEGFGLTLAEAMFHGKPVVGTGYSGNMDFMTEANSYPVAYTMAAVGGGAEPYAADEEWAEPDLDDAVRLLRHVRKNPSEAAARGARAAADIRAKYAPRVAGEALAERLQRIGKRIPIIDAPEPAAGPDVEALIARGGRPAAPSRFGKAGAGARKAVLRAMKPYTAYQQEVNRALAEREGVLREDTSRVDDRLAASFTTLIAELRQQRSLLQRHDALLGGKVADPRPGVVRAIDARIDDLAGQVDALRGLTGQHEVHLRHVGLPSAIEPDAADALPSAPDDEPWSAAYVEAHRNFVSTALDDPTLVGCFRDGSELPAGYGAGFDERVVEYPWLSAQRLGGSVLDAGSVLNHLHVLTRLRNRMDDLHILTLEPEPVAFPQMHVSYLFADLRALPMADATYDRILSVSTLEHVGMDNAYYGSAVSTADDPQEALLEAVRELSRVLKPGGDLYITVPVGQPDRFTWVRALSVEEVAQLVETFAPASASIAYYRHDASGWAPTVAQGVVDARYRDHFSSGPVGPDRTVAAEAVACVHLVKAGLE